MGHYKCDSMMWDEGEIPQCSFCGKNAEETDLQDTTFSGQLCCGEQSCMMELAQESLCSVVEFIEDDD